MYAITIFSISLLSLIQNGSCQFTYSFMPVHSPYFPTYAYPQQNLVPSPSILYTFPGYRTNRGILKAEDFCVSRGLVYNTLGYFGISKPKTLKVPQLSLYKMKNYDIVRSQARSSIDPSLLSALFLAYDSDNDKQISFHEFQNHFLSLSEPDETETQARFLFYLADVNISGGIDENEFNQYMQKMSSLPEGATQEATLEVFSQDDMFTAFFFAYDRNEDHVLSLEEFITNMEEFETSEGASNHGSLLSKSYGLKFAFHLADTNNNRECSQCLTKVEYVDFFKKASQVDKKIGLISVWSKKELNLAIFKTIDENDNYLVSVDELNKLMISGGNILSVQELQLFEKLVDVNGDGKIKYNEIAKIMDAGCRKWLEELDQ